MSLFLLDTAGDQQLLNKPALDKNAVYNNAFANQHHRVLHKDEDHSAKEEESEDESDGDGVELFGVKLQSKDVSKIIASQNTTEKAPSKTAVQMNAMTEQLNEAVQNSTTHTLRKRHRVSQLNITGKPEEDLNVRKLNVELDMQKTSRIPGFEQLKALPRIPKRKQPIVNRAERAKTKGSGWFDLPATEITREMSNELRIIQMRSVLDPKHFYKKNDLKVLPKYFQIGTVQHSPLDHYSEKNTRKTKKSLVDELLQDEAFQKFNKRKYTEVVARTDKYAHRKAMKKMKKLKKQKRK